MSERVRSIRGILDFISSELKEFGPDCETTRMVELRVFDSYQIDTMSRDCDDNSSTGNVPIDIRDMNAGSKAVILFVVRKSTPW